LVKWWFFEEFDGWAPFSADAHVSGMLNMRKLFGAGMPAFLSHFNGTYVHLYWDGPACWRMGPALMAKVRQPGFLEKFEKELVKRCHAIEKTALRASRGVEKASDKELAARLREYAAVHRSMMEYGIFLNAFDYADKDLHNILQQELERYLEGKTADAEERARLLNALATSSKRTRVSREQADFYALAREMQANRALKKFFSSKKPDAEKAAALEERFPAFCKKITRHVEKHAWLSFVLIGPIKWDSNYYVSLLSSMARSGEDANARLKELAEAPRLAAAEKAEAASELRPDALHARLFRTLGEFIYLKGYRKDSLGFALWKMDAVLKEAARRLGLSAGQARFMLSRELEAALEGRLRVDVDLLNERAKECVLIMDAKGLRVLVGKKMRAVLPKEKGVEEGKLKALKELKGVCACPGKAVGAVKIINTMGEMAKMREGDVLVSIVTQPEIVVAMKKASAILTDQGGMTCHAAIVSRELRIPCVIGLKVATKWLHDGDIVEVDAAKGVVKKA